MTISPYLSLVSRFIHVAVACLIWASLSLRSNTQLEITIDDEQSGSPATNYVDDFFLGIAGGTNVLINPDFERGSVGWDSTYAGSVWSIGEW